MNNASSSQNISVYFAAMYLITHKNNNNFSAKVQRNKNSLRWWFSKATDTIDAEIRGKREGLLLAWRVHGGQWLISGRKEQLSDIHQEVIERELQLEKQDAYVVPG